MAVATSPDTLALSLVGGTETLYALWVLLAFLLLARGARPVWIGVVCGLLYVTRYNGVILLPFAVLLLAWGGGHRRAVLECLAGFAAIAAPWLVRNWLVTGNPFFTYYRWAFYFSPFARSYTTTLLHMIEPDPNAPTAMNPFAKARLLLPQLFLFWPLASASLAACAGLVVACVRKNRIALCFAALAIATTVALAFALPRGRYFAPLFPTLVTLGLVGWLDLRTRWKWLGVALLVAAPLLPAFPPSAPDLAFLRRAILDSGEVKLPILPGSLVSRRPGSRSWSRRTPRRSRGRATRPRSGCRRRRRTSGASSTTTRSNSRTSKRDGISSTSSSHSASSRAATAVPTSTNAAR